MSPVPGGERSYTSAEAAETVSSGEESAQFELLLPFSFFLC